LTEQLKQLCTLSKELHVLYVEDDESLMRTTKAMFNNIFNEIEVATNGEEGLEKYNNHFLKHNEYFDIVVTDIKMPKMNGVELSKRIKNIHKQQLIVITSAHEDSANLIEFINLGINKFIKKPFSFDSIVTTFLEIVTNFQREKTQQIIEIDDGFSWKIDEKRLLKDNEEIKLTQNEISILDILLNNKCQVFSNDDLYYILQENNYDRDLSTDSIKAILKRLRKKIPENFIENIYAQGYRINTNKINTFN